MKSHLGLILGFGILGVSVWALAMQPPHRLPLKWFGPHKRGLIAGTVVAGYGGAAIYIGGLGQYFIDNFGISGSFMALGAIFAVVTILCGQLLFHPPKAMFRPCRQTPRLQQQQLTVPNMIGHRKKSSNPGSFMHWSSCSPSPPSQAC
jgi:OFA family oxalate/formate antiporter-like MFS transporter